MDIVCYLLLLEMLLSKAANVDVIKDRKGSGLGQLAQGGLKPITFWTGDQLNNCYPTRLHLVLFMYEKCSPVLATTL